MKWNDLSPSSSPTLSEQQDALQKGLGRAQQWAQAGLLDEGPLLESCLCDQRYDKQFEDLRGDWLWDIVTTVGAQDRFRVPILHALHNETDGWNASQLYEFARLYAAAGDETFRNQLYEIVKQKPFEDNCSLGEEALLKLDGAQGFLFATRVRGQRLATIEWDWGDEYLVMKAIQHCGEKEILGLMSSSSEVDIRRFYQNWMKLKQETPPRSGRETSIKGKQSFSVEQVLAAVNSADNCSWLGIWGKAATEDDLLAILKTLRETEDVRLLKKLIRVFRWRPLPEFDTRLIQLCCHADWELQCRSYIALAHNTHPAIREFALKQLADEWSIQVFKLFVKNFEPGDEGRIFAALELSDDNDDDDLHGILSDVLKVLEANPVADRSQLGVLSYVANPCEICRFKAVQLLKDQEITPAWMLEECRFDSYEETRELYEK